jgi:hypothetical protein
MSAKDGIGVTTKEQAARRAIRWTDLPHDMLWQRSLLSMSSGSRERAYDDSVKHVLMRRLPKLVPSDHFRFIELECARIVELLRAVRDEYRAFLEKRGCKPITEMYWVVFRFGVIPYAVKILRATIFDYIVCARIDHVSWERLFGMWLLPGLSQSPRLHPKEIPWEVSAKGIINNLIHEQAFSEVLNGGLFGRAGQSIIGRMRPWPAVLLGQMTFVEHIEMRQELWDSSCPWTEGLARLFDVSQEELFFQARGLTEDGQRAELAFTKLSSFQRIAYRHVKNLRRGKAQSRNFGRDGWLAVLRELDQEKVCLDAQLDDKAKKVRNILLKKGHKIDSWEQCYNQRATASLEDGKVYSLKREVTHSIHNAAKAAAAQLGKVWNVK